jgi:hypothetical protein
MSSSSQPLPIPLSPRPSSTHMHAPYPPVLSCLTLPTCESGYSQTHYTLYVPTTGVVCWSCGWNSCRTSHPGLIGTSCPLPPHLLCHIAFSGGKKSVSATTPCICPLPSPHHPRCRCAGLVAGLLAGLHAMASVATAVPHTLCIFCDAIFVSARPHKPVRVL